MSDGPPTPKRIRLDSDEILNLTNEELLEKFQEQNEYVRYLESKKSASALTGDDDDGQESEGKLRQHNMEGRRENTLVLRLANKEQELQDCLNQIAEMKQAHSQNTAQLRTMMLDPALNIIFQRMSKEVDDSKDKLKQTQNELSAWKFTPDSQTGKRLMAKCRMLLQENEELGKMIASGRTATLEGEIALQKTLVQEMKKNQRELDEFVSELEEDAEGMQCMIYLLQQQLKDTKEQLAKVQAENEKLLMNRNISSDNDPGGSEREVSRENSQDRCKPLTSEHSDKENVLSVSSKQHSEAETERDTSADLSDAPPESAPDSEPMQVDQADAPAPAPAPQSDIHTADSTSCLDSTLASAKRPSPKNSRTSASDTSSDVCDTSPQTCKQDRDSFSPHTPPPSSSSSPPPPPPPPQPQPPQHDTDNGIKSRTNDVLILQPGGIKDNGNRSPNCWEVLSSKENLRRSLREDSRSPKSVTNDLRSRSPEKQEAMDLSNFGKPASEDSSAPTVRNSIRQRSPSILDRIWSPKRSAKDDNSMSPQSRTKDSGDSNSPANAKGDQDRIVSSVEDSNSRTDNSKPVTERMIAHTDAGKTILNGVEPLTQSKNQVEQK